MYLPILLYVFQAQQKKSNILETIVLLPFFLQ